MNESFTTSLIAENRGGPGVRLRRPSSGVILTHILKARPQEASPALERPFSPAYLSLIDRLQLSKLREFRRVKSYGNMFGDILSDDGMVKALIHWPRAPAPGIPGASSQLRPSRVSSLRTNVGTSNGTKAVSRAGPGRVQSHRNSAKAIRNLKSLNVPRTPRQRLQGSSLRHERCRLARLDRHVASA
jgi:hypothetical protein